MKISSPPLFAFVCLSLTSGLFAELTLPHFFSDHMILQRERQAAIWGRANADAEVTVSFKDQSATAKADAEGRWRAAIQTGAADAEGAVLTVKSGDKTLSLNDVLVGEVWLASGQSNMVVSMNRLPAYADLMAKADYPGLRMFNAPTVTAVEPQEDIEGQWTACTPETVPSFSAVAFFFALKLHQELGIPVGVIKSAWGGKPVETFTSREALNTLPATRAMVDATMEKDAAYDQAKADALYPKQLAAWQKVVADYHHKPPAERGRLPKKPEPPKRPLDTEGQPGVLFNAMIHPFVGYTLRGAIWYQGEGNARFDAVPYDLTLPLMIRDWRQRWGDEFSFYFVQLANFRQPSTEPGTPDPWPLLQDRMTHILATTPKTGMAVINDVGEADDIHPKDKKSPGERLARWALAKDYGRDIVYSSPLFKEARKVKDGMEIIFDHVGSGLKARDGGPLKRFEIAAADRVWHWAEAKISATDTVTVSSPAVKTPAAVRYAWASNPEGANLVNSEGLPASVFRTDDWDDVETAPPPPANAGLDKRRELALEIRDLKAKLGGMDKARPEATELRQKMQTLLKTFRETAPKKD